MNTLPGLGIGLALTAVLAVIAGIGGPMQGYMVLFLGGAVLGAFLIHGVYRDVTAEQRSRVWIAVVGLPASATILSVLLVLIARVVRQAGLQSGDVGPLGILFAMGAIGQTLAACAYLLATRGAGGLIPATGILTVALMLPGGCFVSGQRSVAETRAMRKQADILVELAQKDPAKAREAVAFLMTAIEKRPWDLELYSKLADVAIPSGEWEQIEKARARLAEVKGPQPPAGWHLAV